MRIIKIKTLKDFWEQKLCGDSEQSLRLWFSEVKKEKWENSNDVKAKYGNASIIKDNRIVFNIHGNKYRLIVKINYDHQIIFIRFIGTHIEYDNVNVMEI